MRFKNCFEMMLRNWLLFFIILFFTNAYSEETPVIVISAGKTIQSKSIVGSDVSVIEGQQINESEFFIGDIIGYSVPGMSMFQSGGYGTVTGIQTTTATTIDTLPTATYRSARFQVQITQSTDYQSTDLMAIHNGTTASIVEYGTIATNDYLASFTSTVSGSDMLLQATMASAGIATVKVVRYGVTI